VKAILDNLYSFWACLHAGLAAIALVGWFWAAQHVGEAGWGKWK